VVDEQGECLCDTKGHAMWSIRIVSPSLFVGTYGIILGKVQVQVQKQQSSTMEQRDYFFLSAFERTIAKCFTCCPFVCLRHVVSLFIFCSLAPVLAG